MVVGKVDSEGKLTGDEGAFCDCHDLKRLALPGGLHLP